MLGINKEKLGTQYFKFLYGDVFERFDLAASVCSFKVKTWKVIKYNYDVKAEIHADNFVQVFHL